MIGRGLAKLGAKLAGFVVGAAKTAATAPVTAIKALKLPGRLVAKTKKTPLGIKKLRRTPQPSRGQRCALCGPRGGHARIERHGRVVRMK